MTFKHKLSRRLALLKDRRVLISTAAVAAVGLLACEKPIPLAGPTSSVVARLVVSPKVFTLQQNHVTDVMAVGLTVTGDTADVVDLKWSATRGSITGMGRQGGR